LLGANAQLHRDRAIVLGALAAVVAGTWAYLLFGTGVEMRTMDMGGGRLMAVQPVWALGYATLILVMWMMMMAAMMLPSAALTLLLVAALARRKAGLGSGPIAAALFASGYLLVWCGFSLAATLLQWVLDKGGMMSESMVVANPTVAATMLIAAGAWQWTPLKDICLRHCRSPAAFLVHHWRQGALGAAANGIRHGCYCVGCCGMLMALLFVAGLMNLPWVAAIGLLVLVEKTVPWGVQTTRITGGILAACGMLSLVRNF
jgi:predicted metal-binding membrane protein